jgi:tetratricopeptide (TPR) repeat protein
MSEESQGAISGPEVSNAASDQVAAALALAGASREEADAFLQEQRALAAKHGALIAAQLHHLHEDVKQIDLRIWELRLGVFLRLATLLVGLSVAGALGWMVWDAAHSTGLIVEPFTVPPDLTSNGITGKTIASQILDKLYTIDSLAGNNRSPQSYANNWGNGIKVEIPETGVSISDLRQFLRDWLGHDTHISGEVYRTGSEIVITARVGGERGGSFVGPQSDLDRLVQSAAEYVYGQTQPARYATYLSTNGRNAESLAVLRRMIQDPSRLERAWAWGTLNNQFRGRRDYAGAIWYLRKAISVYPDFVQSYHLIAWFERLLGHPEAALENYRKTKELFDRGAGSQLDPRHVPKLRLDTDLYIAFLLGDFTSAVALGQTGPDVANSNGTEVTFDTLQNAVAVSLGLQHDGIQARTFFKEMPELEDNRRGRQFLREIARVRMDAALEDWRDLAAAESSAEEKSSSCQACETAKVFRVELWPWLALAKAKMGDVAGAETLISSSPGDCYDCVRVRGMIATEARQWDRAGWWFAKAMHDAPSIPFAHEDWGRSLLKRGQPDAAIAQFMAANKKGPHFADPLEGWGEALMAKNQSHLALAKFAEAEKYAPNWGRLHLKWGEALLFSGRKDDAKAQFVRAAQLDLTSSERAELRGVRNV